MRIRKVLSLFVALAAAGTVFGADAASDARKAIQGVFSRYANAWLKLDPKQASTAFRESTTNDYVTVIDGKKVTRSEILATYSRNMKSISKLLKYSTKIERLALKGAKCETRTLTEIAGSVLDPEKKPHKLEMLQRSDMVWVKDGGAWKVKSSKTETLKFHIDGKPVTR